MERIDPDLWLRGVQANRGCDDDSLNKARDILSNRLFLGDYVERRYVEQLKEYRDVITISPGETELILDLDKIRKNLLQDHGAKWLGITDPNSKGAPLGHCIWVKLTNVPFGRFWFQIRQIKCESNEIIFKLKCIRQAHVQDSVAPTLNANSSAENEKSPKESSESSFEFNPAEKIEILRSNLNNALSQIGPHITWENILLVTKFMVAIVIVLVTGLIKAVKYLSEYFLKLIHEMGYLMQSLTPLLIHFLDCLTKIIGGIFCLLAVLFRGSSNKDSQLKGSSNQSGLETEKMFFQVPKLEAPPQDYSHTESWRQTNEPLNWRERNRHLKMQLRS